MCEFLDFSAQGRIRRLTQSRCAVIFSTGDSDQDVFLRPIGFPVDVLELVEFDFELVRTGSDQRLFGCVASQRLAAQSSKIVAGAFENVAMGLKFKQTEEPLCRFNVVVFGWVDEEMDIDEPIGRPRCQAQLDVGKDCCDIGQSAVRLLQKHRAIRVKKIVICDPKHLDLGIAGFNGGQVGFPSIGTAKLVVQGRARRMNMWIPSSPY
nr:hypothetical protein [Yoonia rosea]